MTIIPVIIINLICQSEKLISKNAFRTQSLKFGRLRLESRKKKC